MVDAVLVGDFAARLERLYDAHPFSVTSWWRTPKHNADVGGHTESKHLEGLAVDVVLDAGGDRKAFNAAAMGQGLHFLDEGNHVHVQASSLRWPDQVA